MHGHTEESATTHDIEKNINISDNIHNISDDTVNRMECTISDEIYDSSEPVHHVEEKQEQEVWEDPDLNMFTEDILSTESGKDNLKTRISPKASPPVHGCKCKLCGKMIGRLSTLGSHVRNQHYTAIRGMVSRNSKTMQKIAAVFKEKKKCSC
ncbi:uncharacterized protein LOC117194417 [Drosophila miranda]|uniref:uncharacterized protein LOC117194417 n=1 Tax=Drosophila miranda TaxID=7229 RepID=UPI00143F0D54|nr:uncharacterized protein LOC117194417 [Drosophila miranda]